ncbi:Uncharacterized protein TCM_042057 [Theobroma cacao]|uniref:Uncharacterized protein n=1 Tax=Theobroma cacao TaxID=3641 RepID=A0A061GYM8_THECC|nr:Uncharacterized protein TCM_042057 [Theobroma cacao]
MSQKGSLGTQIWKQCQCLELGKLQIMDGKGFWYRTKYEAIWQKRLGKEGAAGKWAYDLIKLEPRTKVGGPSFQPFLCGFTWSPIIDH